MLPILLAGAALRLWQYFADTSLWIDEIGLAENVIHTPLLPLLHEPLALDQVAAPGFVAALKLATAALGPTGLALRLFPLLCGLASLPLFALLARRTREGWTSLLATGLFALSPTLISYSAEAKQYSTDVCVSVALTLVALGLVNASSPGTSLRFLRAGIAGAIAVWFSQSAVFVVAGLGGALLLLALRRATPAPSLRLAGTLTLWAASAAAAVSLSLHTLTPATRAYMQHFWQPSLPRPVVLVLVVLAAVILSKTRPQAAPLLVAPALLALAAAAAHLYPFSGRAILFLAPTALLALADGAGWIVGGLERLRVPLPVGAGLFAAAAVAGVALHLPVYRTEETRPVLAEIAARRQAGDTLYVYYGAERALRFYGPRVGIVAEEATLGGCHRGQPREYLRELDRLRGRPRVWILFTHASAPEQSAMSGYLERIGARRDRIAATGATAELYDLSDPDRLQAVTAETYPIPEGDPDVGKRFGCGHGPLAATPAAWN